MKKTVKEKLLELQLVSIYLKFNSDLLLKNPLQKSFSGIHTPVKSSI